MAYKTFANGFPLPASDLNNYLMNQSVIVFADSTARTAALPTPTEGMITYLEDTNTVEVYDGSAWTDINDNTAAIPKSTVTTAGDLIVADGASSVTRLGVGTDDQILKVVSGEPAWADAGGGGGAKDWTLLATVADVSGAASYDVSSLSSYDNYMIIAKDITGAPNMEYAWFRVESSELVTEGVEVSLRNTSTTQPVVYSGTTNMVFARQGSSGAAPLNGVITLSGCISGNMQGTFFGGTAGNVAGWFVQKTAFIERTGPVTSLGVGISSATMTAGSLLIYGA